MPMNDIRFENQVQRLARQFPYPPTPALQAQPDEVRAVRRRKAVQRWAPVALAVLLGFLLLGSLTLIPAVRAQVLEFLDIGGIRLFFNQPTATPPALEQGSHQLPGLTTLEAAQQAAGFDLRLPQHPLVSGPPDQVNLLETPAPLILLTWYDPDHPGQVLIRLTVISPGGPIFKPIGDTIYPTRVNGSEGFWVVDPHPIQIRDIDGNLLLQYLVNQPVLLWFDGNITYRLEGDLSREEAVEIAESLQ